MRPSDNPVPAGTEHLAPSALPAVSQGPATGAQTVLGVETRPNGRWRYGRKIRNEEGGVLRDSAGRHTQLPRVTRVPNVPGVNGQAAVLIPQRTTIRRGVQTPDGLEGSCQ
jgi:hypothetical protein